MVTRVDVMSLKGGAGKTTLAFRLAWAQAQAIQQPVLLVDADLPGTCLGDLLEPWVQKAWGSVPNLIDLVCDRPEMLHERLDDDLRLPLYLLRPAPPAAGPRAPARVGGELTGPSIVFCPSHADSADTHVDPALLHALVAHESAGGWVQHVIDELVRRAQALIGTALAGVIVDHSPGMSALPWAVLQTMASGPREDEAPFHEIVDRKALFVTTPDLTDLSAWADLYSRPGARDLFSSLKASSVWALNRMQPAPPNSTAPRAERLKPNVRQRVSEEVWFAEATEIPLDDALAGAVRDGELVQLMKGRPDSPIAPLRARLFGEVAP